MIQLPQIEHSDVGKPARNACKMCSPLGACLAFSGIDGAVPLLHGSQGCATYIRRYLISHFREPMDIASSNFGEHAAIFGGEHNLKLALANVIKGYHPRMIGVATTCLTETIGDDVPRFISQFRSTQRDETNVVQCSTPAYTGSHVDGYVRAVRAVVESLAQGGEHLGDCVNVFPSIVSPADLRHLRELVEAFGLRCTLMPDYAARLDGGTWTDYQKIPPGGTTLEQIRSLGRARASIELTSIASEACAAAWLEERFEVPWHRVALPIGIAGSDELVGVLSAVSGRLVPDSVQAERSRLVDAYVDAHKYVFGRRAVLFGDEDLVVALARLCTEVGLVPVICASGGTSTKLAEKIRAVAPDEECRVLADADFEDIADVVEAAQPDLLIGNSKGAKLARKLNVPLVRIGLPIHDRVGAARLQMLGYRGTQQLFDRIVNAILEAQQDESDIGYSYL